MAAMDALMRRWGVTPDKKFPFCELGSVNEFESYLKPHYSLEEVCKPRFLFAYQLFVRLFFTKTTTDLWEDGVRCAYVMERELKAEA